MQPVIREILQGRYQATNRQGQTQNFDSLTEAQAYAETGTMIEYKGFEIHPSRFTIWKNGKRVFKAPWQLCSTLDEAQIMIDASLMEGSLSKVASPALVLHEIEDDQFGRWMENEHYKQQYEKER